MNILNEIALVRHGRYDFGSGHLTDEGVRQADAAAAELAQCSRFLGAVILTSSAPRAEETADQLAFEAGKENEVIVIKHQALQITGEHPEAMRNLRTMSQAILESVDPNMNHSGSLVVVTHLPLIAAMMGINDPRQIDYGSVHSYEGDGANPKFEPEFEPELTRVLDLPPVEE